MPGKAPLPDISLLGPHVIVDNAGARNPVDDHVDRTAFVLVADGAVQVNGSADDSHRRRCGGRQRFAHAGHYAYAERFIAGGNSGWLGAGDQAKHVGPADYADKLPLADHQHALDILLGKDQRNVFYGGLLVHGNGRLRHCIFDPPAV